MEYIVNTIIIVGIIFVLACIYGFLDKKRCNARFDQYNAKLQFLQRRFGDLRADVRSKATSVISQIDDLFLDYNDAMRGGMYRRALRILDEVKTLILENGELFEDSSSSTTPCGS